jgi:hypothetical protein
MCRLSRARSPSGTTLEEVVSERARDASTTAPNHSIGGFFLVVGVRVFVTPGGL